MNGRTGLSDSKDKRALVINYQLNKYMSSCMWNTWAEVSEQISRGKKQKEKNGGKCWKYFSQSMAEGVPGDFHQQQDKKIRLSKPAPLTIIPSQARLLRDNRHRLKIWKAALTGNGEKKHLENYSWRAVDSQSYYLSTEPVSGNWPHQWAMV